MTARSLSRPPHPAHASTSGRPYTRRAPARSRQSSACIQAELKRKAALHQRRPLIPMPVVTHAASAELAIDATPVTSRTLDLPKLSNRGSCQTKRSDVTLADERTPVQRIGIEALDVQLRLAERPGPRFTRQN